MSALGEVEEVISGLIKKEALNAKIHRDAAGKHFKKATDLYAEAASAYDPDKGNDETEGDRLTADAQKEEAARDAERKKAFAEEQRIKGKQECLDGIRKKWVAKQPIPSPR